MIFKGPLEGSHEGPPVSEADLQAYTDGSIAAERATFVRQYLATRPGEWRRILFYRHLNAQIRRAFVPLVPLVPLVPFARADAAPAAVPGLAAAVRRGGWRRASLAFASAVLLAGAAAGWLAASEPTQQVLDAAAIMALMQASSGAGEEPLASPAGIDAAPFEFQAAGLRLVAVGVPDLGPLALARRYVYETAQGQKIVLLGARAWFANSQPMWSAQRFGALRLIGWTARGTRWELAGRADTRELMRAADVATMAGARRASPNVQGQG